MTVSHRAVIQEIAEDYRLRQQFVEALARTNDERQKMTLLHGIAGKTPDKTGRTLCDFCDCRLSDPVCDNFKKAAWKDVERVLDEYTEAFCPECKQKMVGFRPVVVMTNDTEPFVSTEPAVPERSKFTTERKTKVLPCECLLDEPTKLGAVDRDALDADARDGVVSHNYEQDATRGTDPLDEFDTASRTESDS